MALSEGAITQQINVLTTKTSENNQMVYKSIPALNKGLNPEYFTGNDTKIVNAINKIAAETNALNRAVVNMIEKINSVLLDTYGEENEELWEETQKLMGKETIIEGLKDLLEGKLQNKILNLQLADAGKILSVKINKNGIPEVKPLSVESFNIEVSAYDVAYLNRDLKGITSVGEAIDVMCENRINDMVIENDCLSIITPENKELASVPMMTDDDIENMISSLDSE